MRGRRGLLGIDDRPVAEEVLACERPEDGAAVLAAWLRGLEPDEDPLVADARALVERAEEDTSLVRAEQLAELAGVSLRTLQRRFHAYVGDRPEVGRAAVPAARRDGRGPRRRRRGLGRRSRRGSATPTSPT